MVSKLVSHWNHWGCFEKYRFQLFDIVNQPGMWFWPCGGVGICLCSELGNLQPYAVGTIVLPSRVHSLTGDVSPVTVLKH